MFETKIVLNGNEYDVRVCYEGKKVPRDMPAEASEEAIEAVRKLHSTVEFINKQNKSFKIDGWSSEEPETLDSVENLIYNKINTFNCLIDVAGYPPEATKENFKKFIKEYDFVESEFELFEAVVEGFKDYLDYFGEDDLKALLSMSTEDLFENFIKAFCKKIR